MTAIKTDGVLKNVKGLQMGLQIQRLLTSELTSKKKRLSDAVVKPEQLEQMRGGGGLWKVLTDFLMVGGDFV